MIWDFFLVLFLLGLGLLSAAFVFAGDKQGAGRWFYPVAACGVLLVLCAVVDLVGWSLWRLVAWVLG